MIVKHYDEENHFISTFNTTSGFYLRTGVLDENEKDTGVEPFMASYPELLDIGIMQTCVCAKHCNVDCYQKAINRTGNNMGLEDFESILKQSTGKIFQCALGGAGDVDTHENFEEILYLCRKYNIIANFTTSGIAMTKEKADICRYLCGAVAVSEHFAPYTDKALNMLLEADVKTNLHYVLSSRTIQDATEKLKNNGFRDGINAVIFLLYKPIGLGRIENVLSPDDPRVAEFFDAVDNFEGSHKIGFDSCTCPGIVNFAKKVNLDSIDFCEGARFSAYIDANMNMMPCSFGNQDSKWFVSLREHTIQDAWNSDVFNRFRSSLRYSCAGCKDRQHCGGGCPIVNQVTLCNRKERLFYGENKD